MPTHKTHKSTASKAHKAHKSHHKKSGHKAHKTHHKNGSAYTVEELRARIAKHNRHAAEGKRISTTHKVKGEHKALRKTALVAKAKKAHLI